MQALSPSVASSHFYGQFHGHPVEHLEVLHDALTRQGVQRRVWLAGDSSLDNKAWVRADRVPAVHGYERVLVPPTSRPDVCHWLNCMLPDDVAAINCAVEESTVGQRVSVGGKLLEQDEFLRAHIRADDTLIVSVGGNDFALRPTSWTIIHMMAVLMAPGCTLRVNPSFWALVRKSLPTSPN